MRIFLIEDDRNLRDILTTFLEMKGHEIVTAADPTGCPMYDRVDVPCPHDCACGDALLVDQDMPNMTGLDFIETQLERGCKGSVHNRALMSVDLTAEQEEQVRRLGCNFFKKPFSLLSLLEWLDNVESRLDPERRLYDFDA